MHQVTSQQWVTRAQSIAFQTVANIDQYLHQLLMSKHVIIAEASCTSCSGCITPNARQLRYVNGKILKKHNPMLCWILRGARFTASPCTEEYKLNAKAVVFSHKNTLLSIMIQDNACFIETDSQRFQAN